LSVTSVSCVTGASVSNAINKSVVVGAYSVKVAWAGVAFVDIGTSGFLIIGVCKSVFALTDAAKAGSETDAVGGGQVTWCSNTDKCAASHQASSCLALNIVITSTVVVKPAIVAVACKAAVIIDTAGVSFFVTVIVGIVGAFVNIGAAVVFVEVFVAGVTFAVNACTCGCGIVAWIVDIADDAVVIDAMGIVTA
jgi:hypothetical protein